MTSRDRPNTIPAAVLLTLAVLPTGCTRLLRPPRDRHGPPAVSRRDVNAPFRHADVETWLRRFESPEREVYRRRHEIVASLGLRPGMAVADIGAGTGFFALLFARKVGPQGHVYAVDISPEFLALIRQRASDAGLDNVTMVQCPEHEVALSPASLDLAFICDTYHHFADPLNYMRSVHRAMRPGGRLVLIDFERIEGRSPKWILQHVRAGRTQVLRELRQAGFEPINPPHPPPPLGENYLLWFVRR